MDLGVQLGHAWFLATQTQHGVNEVARQGVVEEGDQLEEPRHVGGVQKGEPHHVLQWEDITQVQCMRLEVAPGEHVLLAGHVVVNGRSSGRGSGSRVGQPACLLRSLPGTGQQHIGAVVHGHNVRMHLDIDPRNPQYAVSSAVEYSNGSIEIVDPALHRLLVAAHNCKARR